MSGNPVHPLEGLNQRVRAVAGSATRLVTLRDQLSEELTLKEGEVQLLTARVEKLVTVGELFRALLDLLVVKQVRNIESVVTTGINTIFHDLDLAFEAEVMTKYNKVAVEFGFRQGAADDPLAIRGRPLDSFGGGPSAVADLILRMLAVLRLKRKPILLLDETLASVSEEYVELTGKFLKELASTMQVDVLLVTHKYAFTDQADRSYKFNQIELDDGSNKLELSRI